MPTGQLKVEGWRQLTMWFANQEVVAAILGNAGLGRKWVMRGAVVESQSAPICLQPTWTDD